MRRVVIAVVVVTSAASASLGSAAGLGGISGGAAAGEAGITACDTTGFDVTYTTSAGAVTAAAVSGIADPACEGAELSLTLTDVGGARIAGGGPVSIATDGDTADNTVSVAVAPNPGAATVRGYHVSVVGP